MPSLTIQIPAELKLEARIRSRLDEKTLSTYVCELIVRDLLTRGQITVETSRDLDMASKRDRTSGKFRGTTLS